MDKRTSKFIFFIVSFYLLFSLFLAFFVWTEKSVYAVTGLDLQIFWLPWGLLHFFLMNKWMSFSCYSSDKHIQGLFFPWGVLVTKLGPSYVQKLHLLLDLIEICQTDQKLRVGRQMSVFP